MVEFRFDIRSLFPQPIVRVSSNLLPQSFRGDRRQALEATSKMSEIIDKLGQLSAVSQKLSKPVTTAQRLRMADNHIVYLLADVNGGNNGSVIGLLKIGTKDLYLFDELGHTRKIENTPCILDFYIHESRQRAGLGKDLFETMLTEEKWKPIKCSIDRPSEKLLGFLKKHYGLERTIPQANNFVLYEGFFDDDAEGKNHRRPQYYHRQNLQQQEVHQQQHVNTMPVSDSLETQKRQIRQLQDASAMNMHQVGAQVTQISPVGRYGARRPTCSMAEIIHSNATTPKRDAKSSSLTSPHFINDAIEALGADLEDLHTNHQLDRDPSVAEAAADCGLPADAAEMTTAAPETVAPAEEQQHVTSSAHENHTPKAPSSVSDSGSGDHFMNMKKPGNFQLSKQHTGMKNMSFGVGMAVTPTNKMEFDQEAREEFGVVKITRPVGSTLNSPSAPPEQTDAMSTNSSAGEGLTDQGYYDLKFYHNKLW